MNVSEAENLMETRVVFLACSICPNPPEALDELSIPSGSTESVRRSRGERRLRVANPGQNGGNHLQLDFVEEARAFPGC